MECDPTTNTIWCGSELTRVPALVARNWEWMGVPWEWGVVGLAYVLAGAFVVWAIRREGR